MALHGVDPFVESDFLPCSLSRSSGRIGLSNPQDTIRAVVLGSLEATSEFNRLDIKSHFQKVNKGMGSAIQVVMHRDARTDLSRAFHFPLSAAQQYNDKTRKNWGVDFVTNTTSMITTCWPITQACQFYNNSDPLDPSISFNCYSIFYGDLNTRSLDGLSRFDGWNSSFYAMSNGSPRNISLASQLNPFLFNVTARVITANIGTVDKKEITRGAIIDAGANRIAFALGLFGNNLRRPVLTRQREHRPL